MIGLLTIPEAARVLRVTEAWLADAARAGTVASRKVGRKRMFTEADLTEYVDRVRVGGDRMAAASRRRRSA